MYTKAALPITLLTGKNTLPIIQTYFEFNHLKQLYRQGWLQHGIEPKHCESVAEHSFSVALLALFLVDIYSLDLDKYKIVHIALIHDLGEVYAGDFTPIDKVDQQEKYHLEKQAIHQILDKLPNCSYWIDLWEEYEQGKSLESQFVRQIDQLEMLLQASVYEHQGLADLANFFTFSNQVIQTPEVKSILQSIENLRNNLNGNLSLLPRPTICNDCIFHIKAESVIECIHPDELKVNCATVTFCSSFQPIKEIDSPCVTFGNHEE